MTISQNYTFWKGSPVTTYEGPIQALRDQVPIYERRTFGPELIPVSNDLNDTQFAPSSSISGINHFHDVIVRMPIEPHTAEIPVGIVSKQYALIQHRTLFDEAISAIERANINPFEVKGLLEMTAFGERMRIGLLLPEKYNLKLNNDVLGLRMECFNSVDGSMKFTCVIGWLRFVCSNGLIVGVADCQSALKIDPPQASKIDPPQVVVFSYLFSF
jgi:hypothetical protein